MTGLASFLWDSTIPWIQCCHSAVCATDHFLFDFLPTEGFLQSSASIFVKIFVVAWWSFLEVSPLLILCFCCIATLMTKPGWVVRLFNWIPMMTILFLNVHEFVCQSVYLIINATLQQYVLVWTFQVCFCGVPVWFFPLSEDPLFDKWQSEWVQHCDQRFKLCREAYS